MLKETKIYFDSLFQDEWYQTKIHYAGEEFDSSNLDEWINISVEPLDNRAKGVGNAREYNFTLYVVCWGETEIDAIGLGDDVVTFLTTNVNDDYITNGHEIIDREWGNGEHVFMTMAFRFKTYSSTCD